MNVFIFVDQEKFSLKLPSFVQSREQAIQHFVNNSANGRFFIEAYSEEKMHIIPVMKITKVEVE